MKYLWVIGLFGGLFCEAIQPSESVKKNIEIALQNKANVVECCVVGGGPAGNMAAVQASRFGLNVVQCVDSGHPTPLMETGYVENWPGIVRAMGSEIMQAQREQVEKNGAVILDQAVQAIDGSAWPYCVTTQDGTMVHAMTVIIATGASPRKLNVPGEKEYWERGVSTCALCAGPRYKNKTVMVIGGGDSALEEAIQLSGLAKDVMVLVRGSKLRACNAMQEKISAISSIGIRYNCQICAIVGDGDRVTGVEVCDTQTQAKEMIPAAGVFLAIGHEPCTGFLKNMLALAPAGNIALSGPNQAISKPGMFAAGDVTKIGKNRQAGIAAGEGQLAAQGAYDFLQECGLSTVRLKELRSATRSIPGLQFYQPIAA